MELANPDLSAAILATRAIVLPELMTAEECSRHLARSPAAVRALLRSGTIPGRRVGRRWIIRRSDLLASLAPDNSSPAPRESKTDRPQPDHEFARALERGGREGV